MEEVQHQVFAEGEDFVVVLADGHLEVQASELGQVPFGVRILGAEDRADAVDRAQVAGDGHLLEELRGLGQVGFAIEVGDFEDSRAALGGGTGEVGRLDHGEIVGNHVGGEDGADLGLELEDGVGGRGASGEDFAIQAGFEARIGVVGVCRGGILITFFLGRGRFEAVLDLERQLLFCRGDDIEGFDVQLEV